MERRVVDLLWLAVVVAVLLPSVIRAQQLPLITPINNYNREVSIMFGGDVMFHQPQTDAAKQPDGTYSFERCFSYIKDSWDDCEAVIFNLETTLSDSHYSGYPMFAAPRQVASDLKASGVTHLMLANNHICDKRAAGITKTLAYIDTLGIERAGCFADSDEWNRRAPLYIKRPGFNIALLNYTYATNGMPVPTGMIVPHIDTVQIAKDIAKAKRAQATNIIVFLHWGNEYQSQPSPQQRSLARWLHNSGVDIVVGSHPHVIQPAEVDSAGVTIYSLGNLISNQRKRYTNGGMLVRLDLVRNIMSGACSYKLNYNPHFVYKAPLGDSPRYYCVPHHLVDSLVDSSTQRAEAVQFFDDTKRLMYDL